MLTVCLAPQLARAHAGPQVRSIVFDREAELHAATLLIANRGLIFGDAQRASWELVCNEVLHVTTNDKPDVAVLPDGRLLVATARGLLGSSDRACNWQLVPGFGEMLSTPALAQHPSEPRTLYLTTYAPGATGLQLSEDGGRSWRELLHGSDTDFLRYVRIAASDPQRMYMGKLGFASSKLAYYVLRSADAGKTWQEQAVELSEEETDLVLLGVSPHDPNLLLAKANAADPALMTERLLVSRDGGKSFESPIQLHTITAVEWSADGQRSWLATDDGLYVSTDAARSFARVGTAELVSCVHERAGALYVCGWYEGVQSGMPGVGISMDHGESFERYMNMSQVLAPLPCEHGSDASVTCEQPWIDWQREILGYAPGSAGAGAAGSGRPTTGTGGAAAPAAGSGGSPPSAAAPASDGSGCALAPSRTRGLPLGAAWLLLALLARGAHRRRLRLSSRGPRSNAAACAGRLKRSRNSSCSR